MLSSPSRRAGSLTASQDCGSMRTLKATFAIRNQGQADLRRMVITTGEPTKKNGDANEAPPSLGRKRPRCSARKGTARQHVALHNAFATLDHGLGILTKRLKPVGEQRLTDVMHLLKDPALTTSPDPATKQ
jgi:hypothetical protein